MSNYEINRLIAIEKLWKIIIIYLQ